MPISTLELATRLQAKAEWLEAGDRGLYLDQLALPKLASPRALSFLSDQRDAENAKCAGAVLVEQRYRHLIPRPLVVRKLPLAIARAQQWLPILTLNTASKVAEPHPGVHNTAVLDPSVRIGENSTIGANSVLTGAVRVGDFSVIGSNVTICGPVSIGNRVRIDANTTIGAQAFMYVEDGDKWIRFPSFAGVQIHDDVDIGAGVTVDRGLTDNTVIKGDVKLDNQVHIGHGVVIGCDTVIAARTTIAGEALIGERCKIGGACSVGEGVRITDDVVLAGMSAVTRTLTKSGGYASAWPVQTRWDWWRQVAKLKALAK